MEVYLLKNPPTLPQPLPLDSPSKNIDTDFNQDIELDPEFEVAEDGENRNFEEDPVDREELMREVEEDRQEEETRRLEKIEEEEENEESESEPDEPTGRANNRPVRFGRVYQR